MSWQKFKIGNFAEVVGGGTPTTKNSKLWNGDIPWITPKDLANYEQKYISRGERNITEEGFKRSSARMLPQNTVLLTSRAPIGYVSIAQNPLSTNQGFKNLICDPAKADYNFIYYVLKAKRELLISHATGSTFMELSGSRLKDIDVSLPSLLVQQKIASILSAYDDLIENNRQRIQLLEESARLLYREWFVRLRFPVHEEVKIIDGVPYGWEKSTLGDNIVLNYGKSLKADDRIEGSYPVYGSSGIVGTHKKPFARGPGIIVGRKGNVGSVFWSSKDFHPIDTVYYIDTESSDYYLYNALQHMQFVSSDAAVPGLNRNYAYSRPYLLPPETIRSHFENTVTPIYGQIFKLDDYNEKLKQARDLLLPRLMNGEIEV